MEPDKKRKLHFYAGKGSPTYPAITKGYSKISEGIPVA